MICFDFFVNWQSRLKVLEDINGSGLIKPFHVIYQKLLILLFLPEPFLVPPLFNSDSCDRAPAVTHSQVERERGSIWRDKFYKNKAGQRKGNSCEIKLKMKYMPRFIWRERFYPITWQGFYNEITFSYFLLQLYRRGSWRFQRAEFLSFLHLPTILPFLLECLGQAPGCNISFGKSTSSAKQKINNGWKFCSSFFITHSQNSA